MLESGHIIYLATGPDERSNELVFGHVVDVQLQLATVEFEDELHLTNGQEVGLYYKINEKLFRLPAKLQMILQSKPRLKLRFTVTGVAMAAEGRTTMRVSTVAEGIPVETAKPPAGRLLDVSGDGMAVMLFSKHKVGDTIDITIAFRQQPFGGKAIVCNSSDQGGGRFRYGLRPAPRELALIRGLQNIAAVTQRERRQRETELKKA